VLGDDEIVPPKRRLEPDCQLAEPRARSVPRAEIEVCGRRNAIASAERGETGGLGGLADLANRQPELRGHLAHLIGSCDSRPRRPPFAEARERRLDHECGLIVERKDGVTSGRAQHGPLASGRERTEHTTAPAWLERIEAVEAESAPFERTGQ
jgi:hypothetical protein